VCSFTAALVPWNGAHGNSDRQRSMVVASNRGQVLQVPAPLRKR
jgi:hypothetical protein